MKSWHKRKFVTTAAMLKFHSHMVWMDAESGIEAQPCWCILEEVPFTCPLWHHEGPILKEVCIRRFSMANQGWIFAVGTIPFTSSRGLTQRGGREEDGLQEEQISSSIWDWLDSSLPKPTLSSSSFPPPSLTPTPSLTSTSNPSPTPTVTKLWFIFLLIWGRRIKIQLLNTIYNTTFSAKCIIINILIRA